MSGRMALAVRDDAIAPDSLDGDEFETFSVLVGAIYDCALAPEGWPAVLRDCAAFIGASSRTLPCRAARFNPA